jgi:anti-sigma factor RsiW
MNSKHITDLDIQALVDGNVDEHASMMLLEAVTNDPALYNRYLVYQKQKKLLKSWWKDN